MWCVALRVGFNSCFFFFLYDIPMNACYCARVYVFPTSINHVQFADYFLVGCKIYYSPYTILFYHPYVSTKNMHWSAIVTDDGNLADWWRDSRRVARRIDAYDYEPIADVLPRGISDHSNFVHYWPCEPTSKRLYEVVKCSIQWYAFMMYVWRRTIKKKPAHTQNPDKMEPDGVVYLQHG